MSTNGLPWLAMALVVSLPWMNRRWTLPFLSVLAITPKVSQAQGKRHKTTTCIAKPLVLIVRRWLPPIPIEVIGSP